MEDFTTWKEKLKDNSNIVSVISKYVPLQRKGRRYWANCPFHYERTPSFAVEEAEQFFHCYGCGVSGDVISFVQKIESCDFIEACEMLAKEANMKMPEFKENESINKLKKQKELVYKILRDATVYYMKNLVSPAGLSGQKYIEKRQLNDETVKHFGIGYSFGWTEVIDYLKGLGYTLADMKMAGIIDEKDGKFYDAYAKRLIFPIFNVNNDIIGFSARLLEDADFAKYKNTMQTIVFDKSRVLYGIQNIKKVKQTEPLNEIIIVEGQMDLISLYQRGIKNVVATMGTALTDLHAKELKKYCNKVVLCFDGDSAGIKATNRSIEILSNAGLDVYVTTIPNNQDPDEFVKEFGKDEFIKLIKEAKYCIEYLILQLSKNYDLNKLNEKSDFANEALKIISKLQSETEKNIYLELVKKITNITVDILRRDLEKLTNNENKPQNNTNTENKALLTSENNYVKAIKFVLSAMLFKKDYAQNLSDDIRPYILNGDYLKIYDYIISTKQAGNKPIVSCIYDMFDVENNPDVKAIVLYEFDIGNDSEAYFKDCIKTILTYGLTQKQNELLEKIKQEKDRETWQNLSKELQQIMLKLRNLK